MKSSRPGSAHAWIKNNILGLVAIFLALSGSAVAAQVATHHGAQVAKKKKVLRGPAGPPGPQGPAGAPGVDGTNGTNGLDGTARAFADVKDATFYACSPNCSVVQSKGVTNVTNISTGRYCVTVPGISPASVAAAVTVDYEWSGLGNWEAWTRSDSGDCPNPANQFEVITFRHPSVTVCTNAACSTTASVAGDAALSNEVGFTIVIP